MKNNLSTLEDYFTFWFNWWFKRR